MYNDILLQICIVDRCGTRALKPSMIHMCSSLLPRYYCLLRIESEGNPKGKLFRDMHRALVESGLGKIVEEYLHIMVCCRLQQPAVAFTDDVGKVERYDSAVHSESIDGEPAKKWCVVVFPALTAPTHGEDPGGAAKVLGRRFVLAKKGR